MTIAFIISMFLSIFSFDNSNTTQPDNTSASSYKIIKPIITDDTGG